jgi:hypothetical protein
MRSNESIKINPLLAELHLLMKWAVATLRTASRPLGRLGRRSLLAGRDTRQVTERAGAEVRVVATTGARKRLAVGSGRKFISDSQTHFG